MSEMTDKQLDELLSNLVAQPGQIGYSGEAIKAAFRLGAQSAVPEWIPFDLSSPPDGRHWFFGVKHGVVMGEHNWRQGWNPDRIIEFGGYDYNASEFSHYLPFVVPAAPTSETNP